MSLKYPERASGCFCTRESIPAQYHSSFVDDFPACSTRTGALTSTVACLLVAPSRRAAIVRLPTCDKRGPVKLVAYDGGPKGTLGMYLCKNFEGFRDRTWEQRKRNVFETQWRMDIHRTVFRKDEVSHGRDINRTTWTGRASGFRTDSFPWLDRTEIGGLLLCRSQLAVSAVAGKHRTHTWHHDVAWCCALEGPVRCLSRAKGA